MVAVDDTRKELVVGIIDVVRTYTWDKKLESWIKDRGFAGGGRNKPTVTSPKVCSSPTSLSSTIPTNAIVGIQKSFQRGYEQIYSSST